MTVLVNAFDESIPAGPADDEVARRRSSPISYSAGSTRASWSRAIATSCSTSPMQLSRSKRRAAEAGVG